MRAYQLYQMPAILDLATQAWEYGRAFTISDTNVATGSIPTKSFSFVNKTCSNGMCSILRLTGRFLQSCIFIIDECT